MRLCRVDGVPPQRASETFRILHQGSSRHKVRVGVAAEQFERMRADITAAAEERRDDATAAPSGARAPLVEHTTTEDVTVGSARYSYRVVGGTDAASAPQRVPQALLAKRRLAVADVRLFHRPYDVRLSISVEEPSPTAALPPADPPKGYTRHKARTSITFPAQHMRYDLTRVRAGRDETYEVELEGVFDDIRAELTEQWVADALQGLVRLVSPATPTSADR
ncbi:RNA triphosphatase [Strigomonas culicis]|nr:RNA triphosphatase [Strigomonas culicis]|eukprot:EPY30261.1 RNA triphosphatase [Strigomonas culicis]